MIIDSHAHVILPADKQLEMMDKAGVLLSWQDSYQALLLPLLWEDHFLLAFFLFTLLSIFLGSYLSGNHQSH